MNCCLHQWIIPDNARINSVVPLNKGKPDKYDILNHRPASILNGFSKVYENIIKTQLVSYCDKYFSPFSQRIEKVIAFNRILFVC